MLRDLPYGKIDYVGVLKTLEEELPEVRSVILMGIYAWDAAFNIVADSSNLHFNREHKPRVPLESFQLYYQIVRSKAWRIAYYLEKRLTRRPTPNSFIDCTACLEACPIGKVID